MVSYLPLAPAQKISKQEQSNSYQFMKDYNILEYHDANSTPLFLLNKRELNQLANRVSVSFRIVGSLKQFCIAFHKRYDLSTSSSQPHPKHSDDTVTRKGIPRPEYTMSILSRN
ncbi:hypothetical protein B5807_09698 [Epicoccum nigrum]|uniref:Uncharacterized protein n=1 Tax=Epicoccum nigrum TaxID=105696 RepID=A0A1Y2LS90_EPING|nr:hypothetical protein B5807_09698 [Epicoccum nigrum]